MAAPPQRKVGDRSSASACCSARVAAWHRSTGKCGAIGEFRLPEDVAPAVWSVAEPVVHDILGRPSRTQQIRRLASALNTAKVAEVSGGAYLILPEARRVSTLLIEDALQSPLAGTHPGWAIIRTAASLLEPDAYPQLNDAVLEVARALSAPIPATCQMSILATVATTRPSKDSASGQLFRNLLGVPRRDRRVLRRRVAAPPAARPRRPMAAGTLTGKVSVWSGTPPPRVIRPAVNPSNSTPTTPFVRRPPLKSRSARGRLMRSRLILNPGRIGCPTSQWEHFLGSWGTARTTR